MDGLEEPNELNELIEEEVCRTISCCGRDGHGLGINPPLLEWEFTKEDTEEEEVQEDEEE